VSKLLKCNSLKEEEHFAKGKIGSFPPTSSSSSIAKGLD